MRIISLQKSILVSFFYLFINLAFAQQPFSMTPNINGFTRIFAGFDQLNGGNISYRQSGTTNAWQTILVGVYDYKLKLNPFIS